jgi:hypothetical protein
MVMHKNARNLTRLRRVAMMALVVSSGLLIPQARAAVLDPGQSAPTDHAATFSGTAIHTETDPFNSGTFIGSLTSTVYQQSNGWLDFVYQFSNTVPGGQGITEFTVSGYNYLFANADDQTDGADPSPNQVSRNPVSGGGVNDTINFDFPVATPVVPGQTSDLLVVDTTATNWYEGSASLIDSATANVQAPAPVPEPATAALAGLSLFALGARRRNRRVR